jgi:hypothetical protein
MGTSSPGLRRQPDVEGDDRQRVGVGTSEICRRVSVTHPTVGAWKRRYAAEGCRSDLTGRGRASRTTDDVQIVLRTLEPLPERLGVTHWSSRLLARELGLSNVKVAKVWREYDGADLSGARLDGANLSTTRDLSQRQLDAAVGENGTVVPAGLQPRRCGGRRSCPSPARREAARRTWRRAADNFPIAGHER